MVARCPHRGRGWISACVWSIRGEQSSLVAHLSWSKVSSQVQVTLRGVLSCLAYPNSRGAFGSACTLGCSLGARGHLGDREQTRGGACPTFSWSRVSVGSLGRSIRATAACPLIMREVPACRLLSTVGFLAWSHLGVLQVLSVVGHLGGPLTSVRDSWEQQVGRSSGFM